MIEANAGDKLEVSVDLGGRILTKYLWVVEHPDTGELWTWHHYDESAPRVPLDSIQEGLYGLQFKVSETVDEQLPTAVGKYLSVEFMAAANRYASQMLMNDPTFNVDKFFETEVMNRTFTLSSEGVWTDFEGTVCKPWEVVIMSCGLTPLVEA